MTPPPNDAPYFIRIRLKSPSSLFGLPTGITFTFYIIKVVNIGGGGVVCFGVFVPLVYLTHIGRSHRLRAPHFDLYSASVAIEQ